MKEEIGKKQQPNVALKSGIWYTVSNVLIKSVSILTAPIFTRILTTSDYGAASNFIAWFNILLIFTGLCLPYSFGRAKIDFSNKFTEYIFSIQILGFISSFFIFLISLFFRTQLAAIMDMNSFLVIVMFIYLIFYPSVNYMQTKYLFEFKYKQNILITYINTAGVIFFSLGFITLFKDQKYVGRIFGTIFVMFIMGIYFFIKIGKEGKKINVSYWKYALKISLPMIPHALSIVALSQIDRIMIIKYSGIASLGIYSFGYSYAILLNIFSNSISQAWVPWLYEEYRKENVTSIRSVNKLLNFLMCYLTVIFIALAPEVLEILGTKEYLEAKWIIFPIAMGALYQYFYNNYTSIELYHKKSMLISAGTIFAGAVNYVLNMIFIPQFGYIAAAYTTLISYFLLMIFHWIIYRKISKIKVFDDKYSFKVIILTFLLGLGTLFLYNYILIRYIIILISLITILFIKQTEIRRILNNYSIYKISKQ